MSRLYYISALLLAISIRSCSGAIIPATDLANSSPTLPTAASPLPDYRTMLPAPGRCPHIPVRPEHEDKYYSRLSDRLSVHSSDSLPVQTITAAILQPQNAASNLGHLTSNSTSPPPAPALAASTIRPLPPLEATSTIAASLNEEQRQQQQEEQQSRYPENHFPLPLDRINASGFENTGIRIANSSSLISTSTSSNHAAIPAGAITLQLANDTALVVPYSAALGDWLANGSVFALVAGEDEGAGAGADAGSDSVREDEYAGEEEYQVASADDGHNENEHEHDSTEQARHEANQDDEADETFAAPFHDPSSDDEVI